MTTPDRRILALASVLLLLLQAVPASALCHCDTPCGPAADRAASAEAVSSCCSGESALDLPSFEGVCCMTGGSDVAISAVVALPAPPVSEADVGSVSALGAHAAPTVPPSRAESGIAPRSAPPSPPPIFLLTVSFLN